MPHLVPAFVISAAVLGGAHAASGAEPGGAPAQAVSWRCEGDQCGGGGPNAPSSSSLMRECVAVVSVIGPVSRYESRGRALSPHELAQCNRRATRTPAGAD